MKKWSLRLQNASILLYVLWLLLPAVQTTGGAAGGALCVALFGLGVMLDVETLRQCWKELALRALCAALLPLLLRRYLNRGAANFWGYYVQQAMFWFPLVFAGHVRRRGDKRAWQYLKWALLFAVTLTTLTTIGWLIQGMLRGGKIYAYSRSLGYAGEGREAYLKELMLRNIGGYDFIYASVLNLPLLCIAIRQNRGWKRLAYGGLMIAQFVMILLSQYTYAMIYAAGILAVEAVAALARSISRGRLKTGPSLLVGLAPLVLALLLIHPLLTLAQSLCQGLGMEHFAFSLGQLEAALQGGNASPDSRLGYYLTALKGFAQSPLLGRLTGGDALLSGHSDLMDLLSGLGLIGTTLVCAMVWLMGRGSLQGLRPSPHRAQLTLMYAALVLIAALGTVCYSRDIPTLATLGALLVLEGEKAIS